MTPKEILLNWLNNAYSMELSLIETLEKHARTAESEDMPEMQEKLEEHVETTRMQAERVKDEIERLGGDVSGVKVTMSSMFGSLFGLTSGLPRDKVVKNAIAEFSSEHFEIATYKAIAKAAELAGEEETAAVARSIMEEEMKTAAELDRDLDRIVEEYVASETEEEMESGE